MSDSQTRGTILIVDDTLANLVLLSDMLSSAGYNVRPAVNGHLALQSANADPPDMILLDVNMPEMNGFEVCRRLKSDAALKSIPVLFISALTDTADKVEAFQVGGVDYITKPFQIEEVLARVKTHLQNRRYQSALIQKSKMLQSTLDDLKKAQSSLIQAEKMASLGVLTAGIAHEINNPINYIKTSVYALKKDIQDIRRLFDAFDEPNDDLTVETLNARLAKLKTAIDYDVVVREIPELMDNITMGVERAEAVVNSLRTYSRPDGDKKIPLKLEELVETALVLLENRYKKKVEIQKEYADLPRVSAQSGRLLQVLINVIGNAIDAVTEDDKKPSALIKLITTTENSDNAEYAVVRVVDNGPGISDAVADKIFDPFFTTKQVARGVGLGMAISYGIIRDHDGRIDVESGSKEGATVSILIPFEGKTL